MNFQSADNTTNKPYLLVEYQSGGSILGAIAATNPPAGTIRIKAISTSTSAAGAASLATPGTYSTPSLPLGLSYNVSAYLDEDGDNAKGPFEWSGNYAGNPLLLDSDKTNINIMLTRPVDTDGDGLPDAWEIANGLVVGVNDALLDKDGDGLSNIQELYLGTNPSVQDSDGDGVFDGVEYAAGMNPLSADTDGDGLPDAWELANGLNPPVNDAALDADGDGLTNLEEFNGGVNSTNPRSRDSNGDGVSDYEERNGVKPTAHSYDRLDRLVATQYPNGAWEGWQYDGNGNIRAHVLRATRDADGDSLPDAWEFSQGLAIANATGTQGFAGDADGDGWTNYQEFLAGTNPNDSASQPPAGGAPGAVWFNPPKARIVLPPAAGGGLAHVSLKLWDAEGNPAQTVLQWFDSATQQWKPATVTRVNGAAFSGTPLITTPAGTTHDVLWNALADLGAFNGIALLRATAQDAAGMTISETVPFAVNTTGDFDGDGLPDAWEIPNGLDPNDATAANGPNGDLDRDGFANLAEFAFNLNPRAADATGKPAVTTAVNPADGKRYLLVTYQRRTGTPALLYDIQTTNELGTWTTNGADLEPVSVVPSGFMETVTVRIHPPLGSPGTPAKFVRIRIRVQ